MFFKDFKELVSNVNRDIGVEFCNRFQQKRKDLKQAGRVAGWNELFGNIHDGWAINKGGNTEVQYHLGWNIDDPDDMFIVYGLGFNAQYVPFENSASPQDLIRPFTNAFLAIEAKIAEQLPDYSMVHGSRAQMEHPQYNEYNLYGKAILINPATGGYVVDDIAYKTMLDDLQRQFNPYIQIFEQKNTHFNMNTLIEHKRDLLLRKKQIILQGPPGTGKTHTSKDIAELIIFGSISTDKKQQKDKFEASVQFKLIQFHPSYSYEDFVRGITAKAGEKGIEYKAENRVLAEFAQDAMDDIGNANAITFEHWWSEKIELFKQMVEAEVKKSGKYYLNDTAYIFSVGPLRFKYEGAAWGASKNLNYSQMMLMVMHNINRAYDTKGNGMFNAEVSGHRTYYDAIVSKFRSFAGTPPAFVDTPKTDKRPYVLIIDEINRANLPSVLGELIYALEYRDEFVETMYTLISEDGSESKELMLPSNLYIIGTMNTADRSVGHIDYAIRRRFAFVNILPDESIITYGLAKQYFSEIRAFFGKYVASDFEIDDVMLGHSYFLADSNIDLKLKLQYEVYPILKEYLKDGILTKNDESEAQLKDLFEKIESINE